MHEFVHKKFIFKLINQLYSQNHVLFLIFANQSLYIISKQSINSVCNFLLKFLNFVRELLIFDNKIHFLIFIL